MSVGYTCNVVSKFHAPLDLGTVYVYVGDEHDNFLPKNGNDSEKRAQTEQRINFQAKSHAGLAHVMGSSSANVTHNGRWPTGFTEALDSSLFDVMRERPAT